MEKRTSKKPREVIGRKRQRQENDRQREGGEEGQERSMFSHVLTVLKLNRISLSLPLLSSEKEEGEEEIQ